MAAARTATGILFYFVLGGTTIIYRTKADYVYEAIKKKIIKEGLQPGDRLVVAELARELDVSPMPVREALIRLSQEEFVEMVPHVGARVIGYNKVQLHEIHQIRIELEAFATRLLAPVITDKQIATLDTLLDAGRANIDQPDVHVYYDWNQQFHFTIAEMNPNRLLEEHIKSAWQKLLIISSRYGAPTWRNKESFAEHCLWVEALKTRDPSIAEAACRKHCSAVGELNIDAFFD